MKSYYNKYDAMPDSHTFADQVESALKPLIKAQFDEGFNPSEIMDVVFSIASMQIAELKIRHGLELRKRERENAKVA